MSKECAFCRNNTKLTREHLWPQALHKRMKNANQLNESSMWIAKVEDKLLKSEPSIKDVCEKCNNGVLSQLDNYICSLFDSTFNKVVEKKYPVSFDYDYHMLKRWLIKMCFNSARLNNSPDKCNLSRFTEYILGFEANSSTYVQLFLQMTYPQEIPQCELPNYLKSKKPFILEPK